MSFPTIGKKLHRDHSSIIGLLGGKRPKVGI